MPQRRVTKGFASETEGFIDLSLGSVLLRRRADHWSSGCFEHADRRDVPCRTI